MALSFGDIANLEQRLVELGRDHEKGGREILLRSLNEWFDESYSGNRQGCILPEDFARLCEFGRSHPKPRVCSLAFGALLYIIDHPRGGSDMSRFVARFALNRIRCLTGQGPLWSGMPLDERERLRAEELFNAAVGDRSYSDEDLFDNVCEMISKYGGSAGLFGRLAHDLSLLIEFITMESTAPDQRETARAALTYFSVVSDAIPDDLGPVGLIDDMYVVSQAIREICPARGLVVSFLDEVTKKWPFLNQLNFEFGRTTRPASEYMITNVALAIEELEVRSASTGIAVVVPEIGPLPLLAGFVRAVAEVVTATGADELPRFRCNDLLTNRETGKKIQFLHYTRLENGTEPVPCPAEDASYFTFLEPMAKKKANNLKRTLPIKDIYCFWRSDGRGAKRISKTLLINPDRLKVGSLERLVGSTRPIVIPPEIKYVVVVGPIGYLRELVESVGMFGCLLKNVVPTGRAYLEDEVELELWSDQGFGGRPVLTFVRTPAEAARLVEDSMIDISVVIAACRPGTTDMMNLGRIAAEGVRVQAFVEERDEESLDYVGEGGFTLWVWDSALIESLYWREDKSVSRDPLTILDDRARKMVRCSVKTVELNLAGLDDASESLAWLQRQVEGVDDPTLKGFIGACFCCLTSICRFVGSRTELYSQRMRLKLESLNSDIERNKFFWTEEYVGSARRAVNGLQCALEELVIDNPKLKEIREWVSKSATGNLVTGNGGTDGLKEDVLTNGIALRMPRRHEDLHESAMIGGWYGKSQMSRLLVPPMSRSTHLLLYGPELQWYRAHERRREAQRYRLVELARQHPPFPGMEPPRIENPAPARDLPRHDLLPEDMNSRARREIIENQLRLSDEETIPARLVRFAGDSWALYTAGHVVNTLVSSVGAKSEISQEDLSIRTIAVEELEPGDQVLLLRGSERDVIRSRVDEMEGSDDLRRKARIWQDALRRYRNQGHPAAEIRRELIWSGCKRSIGTIKHWLDSDTMIGPRDRRNDLNAILALTKDPTLQLGLQECIDAISDLMSLHHAVARQLSREVIDKASDWLIAVELPEEVVEIDERLLLLTVEAVDVEPVASPRSLVNKLQEDT